MSREQVIKDALERAYYRIELVAHGPDELDPSGADEEIQAAVTAAIASHDDSVTLLVDVGIDDQGVGYVTARAIDVDGNSVAPTVLDLGDSFMMQTPVLTR